MDFDKIKKNVKVAREHFGIKEYPGNFFEHIVSYGDYINKFGLLLFKQDIGKTSGFIGYASDETPLVCINYKRNLGHQNFTLGHEMGHYFLHKGIVFCDTSDEIEGISSNELEQEAHSFAAELIYPESLVKEDYEYIEKKSLLLVKNVEPLADYVNEQCKKYCISFTFALNRLLFVNKWRYPIRDKVFNTKKKIGKLSDRYEPHLHIVVKDHPFFKPYSYPVGVMKEYIDILVKKNKISTETGTALYERNLDIER